MTSKPPSVDVVETGPSPVDPSTQTQSQRELMPLLSSTEPGPPLKLSETSPLRPPGTVSPSRPRLTPPTTDKPSPETGNTTSPTPSQASPHLDPGSLRSPVPTCAERC